jgi:hypothetical protein
MEKDLKIKVDKNHSVYGRLNHSFDDKVGMREDVFKISKRWFDKFSHASL